MALIGLTVDFSGYSGFLVIAWRKASSPTVIQGQSDGIPFPADLTYPIEDLEPVVYTVQFWQSANGVTLDTLLRSWSIDAAIGGGQSNVRRFDFIVGSSEDVGDGVHLAPNDQDTSYRNDLLASTEVLDYTVNKQGFGDLSERTQITKSSLGGFDYTNGEVFAQDEEYGLTVYYRATAVTAPSSRYDGVYDADANFTLGSAQIRKLVKANWPGAVGVINLNPLTSYANDDFVRILTHTGQQNNVRIMCTGLDKIWFNGVQVAEIVMGKGDNLTLYFDGTEGYVEDNSDSWNWIGTVRWGYDQRVNELPLDGCAFVSNTPALQELSVADYPRLKSFIDSLPMGRVVSYSQWNTQQEVTVAGNKKNVFPWKGMFALSADGTKVKLPDFRNISVRTLRFYDATEDGERLVQGAGGFQPEDIIGHIHGYNPGDRIGESDNANDRDVMVPGNTGKDTNRTGGTETRTANYGLPAYIKI